MNSFLEFPVFDKIECFCGHTITLCFQNHIKHSGKPFASFTNENIGDAIIENHDTRHQV